MAKWERLCWAGRVSQAPVSYLRNSYEGILTVGN